MLALGILGYCHLTGFCVERANVGYLLNFEAGVTAGADCLNKNHKHLLIDASLSQVCLREACLQNPPAGKHQFRFLGKNVFHRSSRSGRIGDRESVAGGFSREIVRALSCRSTGAIVD